MQSVCKIEQSYRDHTLKSSANWRKSKSNRSR